MTVVGAILLGCCGNEPALVIQSMLVMLVMLVMLLRPEPHLWPCGMSTWQLCHCTVVFRAQLSGDTLEVSPTCQNKESM